jgi:4-hydroxybenzoate polyprenyltransferase
MIKLKKIARGIFNFVIYGNLFIALCATMSVLSTVVLFSSFVDENDVKLALFVGTATFFLYNLHKPITYFMRQQLIGNQRFRRTEAFRGPLSIMTILAGFYCLCFFFYLKLNSQILLVALAFLSFGYILPIFGGGRRLRDLAYLKIFLIAAVWAATTIGFPYFELKNSTTDAALWQLLIERSCFIFTLCIPFDIRDMAWDEQTNVRTIPLKIGAKNAKIVGVLALFIAILMLFLLKNAAIYSETQSLALAVLYSISAFILIKTHEKRSDYFFYGVVDGLILAQSLVIILG